MSMMMDQRNTLPPMLFWRAQHLGSGNKLAQFFNWPIDNEPIKMVNIKVARFHPAKMERAS
jgi:hypothetical protein